MDSYARFQGGGINSIVPDGSTCKGILPYMVIGTWQLEASLSKYLSLGASWLKWVTVCGTPHPQSWCKVVYPTLSVPYTLYMWYWDSIILVGIAIICVCYYCLGCMSYADPPPTRAWGSHHSQQQTVLTLQNCFQDQWWKKTFAGTCSHTGMCATVCSPMFASDKKCLSKTWQPECPNDEHVDHLQDLPITAYPQ